MKLPKRWRFSIGLYGLILILCLVCIPNATRLTVYSSSQKEQLAEALIRPLENTAVEQARIVAPNYDWIHYDDPDLSPEIQNALKESAISSTSLNRDSLAGDSNLSWIVEYDGKTFRHNWPEDLDQPQALLSLTLTSSGTRTLLSSDDNAQHLPQLSLLNMQNRGIVNPNLLDDSDGGSNEFLYTITLPPGFSIHFMIPQDLKANGGMIANAAARLDEGSTILFLALSAAICAAYVLIIRFQYEKESPAFMRFIRFKALLAWILLAAAFGLFGFGSVWLAMNMTSGDLTDVLLSMGISPFEARMSGPVITYICWFLFLYFVSLAVLYIKYIFAEGFLRYLREDSLTASLIHRGERGVQILFSQTLERWMLKRVVPVLAGVLLLIAATVIASLFFFGPFVMVILLLIELLMLSAIAYRSLYLLRKDYETTLAAAKELAAGNFSYVQPANAGVFQSMYSTLIDIKDGFQNALKDGLHSQNMKTQLISNVSHDLKTPVTGIKSYAELISLSDNIDDIRNYARHLDGYTDRLNRLITDLFDVARATSGDIRLNPTVFDMASLAEQISAEWSESLQKKNMSIVLNLQEKTMVLLDPDKTMRILDNLFSNINKYGMDGTRVFVTLRTAEKNVRLSVKNISGIPLDFSPEEITERFVRGDKSRSQPGAGLGLAIVKSFTEVQNGICTIEIDGDVFTAHLDFPAYEQPQPEEAGQAEPAAGLDHGTGQDQAEGKSEKPEAEAGNLLHASH